MASDPSQQRSTSGSGRTSSSSSSRSRPNPQQQLSQIEKSVTHLLVATKQLLETLTMWSRGSATETEVSDVYVRLGYEFNIACRAFNSIGVDTQDLGPVPDLLRAILEETLSQEASQASLDKFLPRIRDIIINLLHGLKKKQSRLRQKTAQGTGSGSGAGSSRDSAQPARQASVASVASGDTSMTQALDEAAQRAHTSRAYSQRQSSAELHGADLPPRSASVNSQVSLHSPRKETYSPSGSLRGPRETSRDTVDSTNSSMSSNTLQSLPVVHPGPDSARPQAPDGSNTSPPPPPPPPKQAPVQTAAMAALQRGGDLERRASRRFSAYQIQKHLGTGSAVSMLPPAQHSPIPNRGRDAQESLDAIRSRGTQMSDRTRSAYRVNHESSPLRNERLRTEDDHQTARDDLELNLDVESPFIKTPEDKLGSYFGVAAPANEVRVELPADVPLPASHPLPDEPLKTDRAGLPVDSVIEPLPIITPHVPDADATQMAGKDITLFLQYKSKIKKFSLPDAADLSIARLQLAFIEKFAWNTHNNGVDLPEIYIQDPLSGVRHELEDLTDVKDRSVLVLNVEALDEVKRHIDDSMGELKRLIEGIKSSVDDQQSALQRVSDRQQDAAKEIAGLAAAPIRSALPTSSSKGRLWTKDTVDQLDEVRALRRDLAVVRQTYTSFVSDMEASMAQVRSKASAVTVTAIDATIPKMDADTGRAYVNKGKKLLQDDSEKIVTAVDDLQDTVEDLRKDVVTRGVRPLARQLETVSKDISLATSQLKKLQEYLRKEKPVWTKIWEKELQVVCDDRDLLTMQEELCVDLEDDLEKAAATFALVEQATRQQNLENPKGTASRSTSRTLNPLQYDRGADPHKAKDGVLGEVRALRPNHETRLEAIDRAEKARQRELAGRGDGEFKKELGSFVEEGKLKKSGGFEEVERQRKLKDEKARREYHERMAARLAGMSDVAATPPPPPPPPLDFSNGDDGSVEQSSNEGGNLEVPDRSEGGASPEPEFVEAREDLGVSQ